MIFKSYWLRGLKPVFHKDVDAPQWLNVVLLRLMLYHSESSWDRVRWHRGETGTNRLDSVHTLIGKFSTELSKLTHGLAWVYFCLVGGKKDDSIGTQKDFHSNKHTNHIRNSMPT